ncbi:MAG: endonuclease domain-containing protein [Iphinoe sp. HA4291-MV1]|jgi:hypothetical protein|nr:endonuclease domain-containing protein [Iphinoe sp. HA4291-MV1]
MIVNRPLILEEIPYYKKLPRLPFAPNFSALPEVLKVDVLTLDGIEPITLDIAKLYPSGIPLQPSQKAIDYYLKQEIKFQMVFVVANFYDLRCVDGILQGRPYSISLIPASKRGRPQEISPAFFKNFSIEKIFEQEPIYLNFNPFKGEWDLFGSFGTFFNSQSKLDIYTDSIGFIIGIYFLANKYSKRDILLTDIVSADNQTRRKYRDYRIKRYYTPFSKPELRKLWGADSPIELFLIHALANRGLFPKIQTSIFRDGSVYANFYDMVSAFNVKEEHHLITAADLYFEQEKLAVFCDSKQYHSSDEAKRKDKNISDKLTTLGITSLRISGSDIVHDLLKCVAQIEEQLTRPAV